MNVDIDKLYDEFISKMYLFKKNEKRLLLEEIGININDKVKNNEIDPTIGREEEINQIQKILLRRTKNNPLLIGEPGVGKTAIVEGLATLIETNNVPLNLQNKRIISLDMASAVAGTKYRGEFEERMKKIIKEVEENQNIILFIDEIHTLIGAGGAEGAIDASNILKPALARGKIHCIGATTTEEFKKHFEKDKALERRFQIINIKEPTIEETKNILYKTKHLYEKYHNVKISNKIIDQIVSLSEKYIYERFRPDKQLDILDEVCSNVNIKNQQKYKNKSEKLIKIRNKKEECINKKDIKKALEYKIKETEFKNNYLNKQTKKNITIKDIAEIISKKTTIPIYEITKEKNSVQSIKTILTKNIFGQDEVIEKIINITKKIKYGYKEDKCLSLLFVGNPGVGKTKLAKLYGEYLANKILIYNMSEYSDENSISKFIGSSPGYVGYDDNKYALNTIKDNPNATIILDEIDKAHPKIINLICQILENSKIKDAKNNIINFSNNIIIMITNKGISNNNIGFKQNNNIYPLTTISKSILNRTNEIIVFKKLDENSITKIINQKIKNIKEKYKDTNITISKNIIKEIIKNSNYSLLGAKKIEKLINTNIDNKIIESLINNNKNITINWHLEKEVI